MHSLQKRFHDFILREELLDEGDQVLLAVSGGLDSMVMVDLFFKAGFQFAIAHCNFGLRGEESDGDEVLVKDWCMQNGVTLHNRRFELDSGSIQLKARNVRYEWFKELCAENGYKKLATAHHLNDSFETAVINLTRGTGPRGILGIRAKAENTIRPLLFASREELKRYAFETSLEWREDSSNNRTDYDRNSIRLEVVPKLEEMNPSLISTFSNTSERLSMAAEIVKGEVDKVKKDYLHVKGDILELGIAWVEEKSDLLVFSEILSEFGFNYATSKEIKEALGQSGKIFFSSNYELSVDRTSIFLSPVSGGRRISETIHGPGTTEFEGGLIIIKSIEKEHVNFDSPASMIYIDADQVQFPMQLRTWQEGDKFQPLGMKGSKKVSDFLIDSKVPVPKKKEVMVLVSGNEIVWLVGYQVSDKAKIRVNTQKVLQVELAFRK